MIVDERKIENHKSLSLRYKFISSKNGIAIAYYFYKFLKINRMNFSLIGV